MKNFSIVSALFSLMNLFSSNKFDFTLPRNRKSCPKHKVLIVDNNPRALIYGPQRILPKKGTYVA